MKCAICNEETIDTNVKMWGCDFAHVTCIKAYSLGKDDARALAATTAPAPTEPVFLDHIACIEDGVLRFMSGRKAPAHDCELYAMPGGKNAPPLYLATPPSAVEAAQPEAVGWKRVPIEPTPDMRDAGGRATRSVYSGVWKEHRKPNEVMCAYIYRAMLAAAPTTESASSPSDAESLDWLTVAEHGLPDIGETVLAGFWYTDSWLKPEFATRFMFGTCSVLEDKHRDFPLGKRWQTFGPSHSQITHWKRITPPPIDAAIATKGGKL